MKPQTNKLHVPLLALCALLGGALPGFSQPTSPPNAPTIPAGQVLSLYNSSGTYTDVPGVNFYEQWWDGQWTSYGDYVISSTSSVVKGYQGLFFTGVGFEGNPQDVSGYVYLHVDVYTPNGNSFAVRLVNTTQHLQADVTYTTASGVIVPNTWNHLDIPLSQFAAANPAMDLHGINQMGWIINNAGETPPADYYIDNVYFYTPPPTPVNVAITSPAAGATVGNYFSISASANVYPGSVTNVSFYDGSTLLGYATSSPFKYYVGSGATAGAHALKAVATDSSGNSATSSVVNITVTNNPPLVVHEPFNYPLGTFANNTVARGTGLGGKWTVANDTIVAGLSYPNLPSFNYALKQNQASTRSLVNFAYPIAASGTKYVSFLFQNVGNSGGDTVGTYLIGNNATSLFVGFNGGYSAAQTSFGLGSIPTANGTAGSAATMWNTVPVNNTNVHLVVLKIDFNTSGANDTVSLWIDPPAGTNSPGAAANVVNSAHDIGTITGFGLDVTGGYAPTVDELNVGDTYGDVVGSTPVVPTIATTVALSSNAAVQVSWTAYSTNSYQVQKSSDGYSWVNWGSVLSGNGVMSIYDTAPEAYYKVLEQTPGEPGSEVMFNGSFENPDFNSVGAQFWNGSANTTYESVWVTNQWGSLTPVEGVSMLYMEGSTASNNPVAPNPSVQSEKWYVTGGLPYNLQFSAANPVKVGGGNPQYHLIWFNDVGAVAGENWGSFASAGSTWTQFSITNVAPANAAQVRLQFIEAVGAGAGWDWVTLIDNVSLHAVFTLGPVNELTPTVQPGAFFTASVLTNGVAASDATGTITFKTNNVRLSASDLVSGGATSSSAVLNPPYTVTAVYSGDSRYIGSTGSLSVGGGMSNTSTNISYSVSGRQLTLSWPADHQGWFLQSQTNSLSVGLRSNWVDVPGSETGTQAVITINPASPAVFFRLRHP